MHNAYTKEKSFHEFLPTDSIGIMRRQNFCPGVHCGDKANTSCGWLPFVGGLLLSIDIDAVVINNSRQLSTA